MFINVSTDSIGVTTLSGRAPRETIDSLAKFPVALIGDVNQRMGMMAASIRPVSRHTKFHGTILPILTREGDNLAIHRGIDEALPGDVLVINANGETGRAVFGDLLAEICLARGIAAVVIDGAARDIEEIENTGLPVFARGVCPAGPSKTGPGTVGLAVACGHVVCHPGDAIFGDKDGVIVVPKSRLEASLAAIVTQDEFESDLRVKIRASATPSITR